MFPKDNTKGNYANTMIWGTEQKLEWKASSLRVIELKKLKKKLAKAKYNSRNP